MVHLYLFPPLMFNTVLFFVTLLVSETFFKESFDGLIYFPAIQTFYAHNLCFVTPIPLFSSTF